MRALPKILHLISSIVTISIPQLMCWVSSLFNKFYFSDAEESAAVSLWFVRKAYLQFIVLYQFHGKWLVFLCNCVSHSPSTSQSFAIALVSSYQINSYANWQLFSDFSVISNIIFLDFELKGISVFSSSEMSITIICTIFMRMVWLKVRRTKNLNAGPVEFSFFYFRLWFSSIYIIVHHSLICCHYVPW